MKYPLISINGKLRFLFILLLLLIRNTYADNLDTVISYLQQQNWSGAISAAVNMEKHSPDNSTLFFLKGVAQFQNKEYRASKESLTRAISLGKVSGEVYYFRGIDNLYLKEYTNSIKDFTTTLRDKNSHIKLTNLSALIRMKDNPQQYLSTIYFFRAVAYMDSGKYQKGLADANTAFNLAVSLNYSSYKIMADLLYLNQQYQKSYDNYLKSIELNPSNASTHYGAGLIDMYFGNYSQALSYFNTAMKFAPGDINTEEKIGLCQLFSNDSASALQTMLHNYNTIPTEYNSFYLGFIYSLLNDSTNAKKYYDIAFSINNNILKIISFICNNLPDSSPARIWHNKMIASAEEYLAPTIINTLKITSIRVMPNPVTINQDFQIIISISASINTEKPELSVPFLFTISQKNKVLFTSERYMLRIPNGRSAEWIEKMGKGPMTGDFTLTVAAEYDKMVTKETVNFKIE